jgi:RNA polymerase sigma factor (sigma-70 family)
MSTALDNLLAQLCSGNTTAAAQAFLTYEPFLRLAVRRHLPGPLRAKFDSADVVQSVWADMLRGFREGGWRFTDAEHLRAFLFVATRNRLIDLVRAHQKAVQREEPLGDGDQQHVIPSPQPRPSEEMQASDLWERILAHCPPEHHAILGLRRQGYTHSEIAQRTGLHADSVRRILRLLARKLAFTGQ